MFARGLFRRRQSTRRMLGLAGALLAVAGGLFVFVVAASSAGSLTAELVLSVILGFVALLGASRIYRSSKAMLFARARLTAAGILTAGVGVVLVFLGQGTAGIIVLAGGIVALVARAF